MISGPWIVNVLTGGLRLVWHEMHMHKRTHTHALTCTHTSCQPTCMHITSRHTHTTCTQLTTQSCMHTWIHKCQMTCSLVQLYINDLIVLREIHIIADKTIFNSQANSSLGADKQSETLCQGNNKNNISSFLVKTSFDRCTVPSTGQNRKA